jgi:NAD(P)H-hydrate epimerase
MTRPIPQTDLLPHALYRAEQIRELDRCAIEDHGIPGAELMERAGTAAYRLLRDRWPDARDLTLLCGAGNNGGDGYVVARLARQADIAVRVLQLGDASRLRGDAQAKAKDYRDAGGAVESYAGLPRRTDLIVDAIFGTGLEREVEGTWATAIDEINAHSSPKLAIDIPSGLHADTGQILGTAVRANATISYIGLKQGMFTGRGPDCCGEIRFDALQVPAVLYSREILSARRLDWSTQSERLGRRMRSAHKGSFGHVLIVGGAPGFSGAPRMAAMGALRAGAGLVTVATHPEHASLVNVMQPELMWRGVTAAVDLVPMAERATVIALGPGLGQDQWGRKLFEHALQADRPLVIDADGLNLLAGAPRTHNHWVLTPHPGEAARLLGSTTRDVQADRFTSVRRLQERFGGVAVLKGAGTLIFGPSRKPPGVCDGGNPGMASGGTGDVLTGVIAALMAQGLSLEEAACSGVCLHAAAGDAAATGGGERGMLASDLIAELRPMSNLRTGQ